MKINLPGVLFIFAGVILIYSGYQRRDPRNVILEALGSKRRVPGDSINGAGTPFGHDAAQGAQAGAEATKPAVTIPSGYGPIVSV